MSIDSRNVFVFSPLDITTATGSSTGAATAVASVAAQTTGVRNVAKRVQASMSCASNTVQVPYGIGLYDGASSAGTLLKSWQVTPYAASIGTNGNVHNPVVIDENNLHIRGTAATAMALSGQGNAAAGTNVSLNLQTYAFPKANPTAVTNAA